MTFKDIKVIGIFAIRSEVNRVGAEVTLSDRLFHIDGPPTGNARPLTVDSLMDVTSR